MAPDGELYVLGLGDEVEHYSSAGAFVGDWVASPPEHGETWDERRELMRRAAAATEDAGVDDLIVAIVYGSWTRKMEAGEWLKKRGAAAIPATSQAVLRFGGATR